MVTTFGQRLILFGFLGLNFGFNSSQAFASPACQQIFVTDKKISDDELQKSINSLAAYIIKIDAAQAEGSSSTAITAMKADYRQKESDLLAYIIGNKLMSREELVKKIKDHVVRVQQHKGEEAIRDAETLKDQIEKIRDGFGKRLVSHRMEPGEFKMVDEKGASVEVEITKPFELMSTKTTKVVWDGVLRLAEQHGLRHDLRKSFAEGETFATKATREDVNQWIRLLNNLSKKGIPEIASFIRYHKAGDVYRLPTEAEWEYVAGNYRRFQGDTILKYGWFIENVSTDATHIEERPVASLAPISAQGYDFFDLFGLHPEWTADLFDMKLLGGKDPLQKKQMASLTDGPNYVIRGMSLFSSIKSMSFPTDRSLAGPTPQTFRLVRVVK